MLDLFDTPVLPGLGTSADLVDPAEERMLIEQGSKQKNLWGINLHPDKYGSDLFVEFDSMINLRPSQDNPSRSVINPGIRTQITSIVDKLVIK